MLSNHCFCTTLSVSHIVVEELWSIFLHEVASAHWNLYLWTGRPRIRYSISIRMRSGLWAIAVPWFFFLDLLLCMRSLFCCMMHIFVNFWLSAKSPGPVAVKEAQITTHPPPCLTVSVRCLYATFDYLQTCCSIQHSKCFLLSLFYSVIYIFSQCIYLYLSTFT